MTLVCATPDCTENGIRIPLGDMHLLPGEVVLCGGCGQPCDVLEAEPKDTAG